MITTALVTDLFRHMEWADASVWRAVGASDAARHDANLRERLYHLHLVQRAFLRTWRGEQYDAPYPTFDDTLSLGAWARTCYPEAFSHVESLADPDLARPMPLPWAARVARRLGQPPAVTSVGETMLQVAMHSTYHRGQVNSRLREIGGEPPLVDYIAWTWFGRPAPEWPDPASVI